MKVSDKYRHPIIYNILQDSTISETTYSSFPPLSLQSHCSALAGTFCMRINGFLVVASIDFHRLTSQFILYMHRLSHLKQSYTLITTRNYPPSLKTHLLQPIIHQLKILQNQNTASHSQLEINSIIKNDKTLSTFGSPSLLSQREIFEEDTINTGSFLDSEMTAQELQAKIIENQRLKCYLNEEIETLEDDYFQRQKILLTKREVCEQLDDEIAQHSYEITKKSCRKRATTCQEERKSLKMRIKHFFWQ